MIIRRTTALLLLLAFVAYSFNYYVVVVNYYLNKSAYIENCVNKDKPWMHCNGKCQMHKQLAQQQNNSDKRAPERRSGNDSPLLCNSFFADAATIPGFLVEQNYPECAPGKTLSMPRSFFHPPGNNLS